MRSVTAIIGVVIGVLIVQVARCQDASDVPKPVDSVNKTSAGYGHLQFFHSRAGTWKAEGTLGGEEVSGQVTYEWILDKAVLVGCWDFQVGAAPSTKSLEVIAWDPKEQRVKAWTFTSDGAHYSNVFATGMKIAGMRVDGVTSDGKPLYATGVCRTLNKDEWEIAAVIPSGIAEQTGEYFAHFTRSDAMACDIAADGCSVEELEGLAPLGGKWRWTAMNADGEEEELQGEVRWVLGGKYQVWNVSRRDPEGLTPTYMALRGWDPASQQVRAWGFGVDGSVHHSVWNETSTGWSVISKTTREDGEVTEQKTTVNTSGKTPAITVISGPAPQQIKPQRIP